MASDKKWYSYFVTIEDSTSPGDAPSPSSPSGGSNAAQAIADIAASIQPPATQQRVEQKIQTASQALPAVGEIGRAHV